MNIKKKLFYNNNNNKKQTIFTNNRGKTYRINYYFKNLSWPL